MSKKSAGMIVGMLVCALLAGCETTKLTSGETDMDKGEKKNEKQLMETLRPFLTETEKIDLADAILERMMSGINKDDYALYSGNFHKGMEDQFPEKRFRKFRSELREDLGEYKSRTYIGILNKKLADVFIWKAKFSNSDDDCLIRLTLIEDEGVYKVLGFHISRI